MIKELIFSGKKYYEGTMPNYIGKTIKLPRSIAPQAYEYDGTLTKRNDWETVEIDPNDVVTAQVIDHGKVFLGISHNCWLFALSDLVQNGGVSASYMTHALLHRKELAA